MSAPRGIFITGTDTGVGKTVVAVALLRALVASGRRAVGMKPVSAGIEADGSVNADVVALDEAGNVDAPVADRNPFAFAPAIAPHLAAAQAGVTVDLAVVAAAYARLASRCDVVVVEGAGGVLVPVDATQDMLDIAASLHLPVVLVVGMRLGCLNHALLSAAAIHPRACRSPDGSPIALNPGCLPWKPTWKRCPRACRRPGLRPSLLLLGASPVLSLATILGLAL